MIKDAEITNIAGVAEPLIIFVFISQIFFYRSDLR